MLFSIWSNSPFFFFCSWKTSWFAQSMPTCHCLMRRTTWNCPSWRWSWRLTTSTCSSTPLSGTCRRWFCWLSSRSPRPCNRSVDRPRNSYHLQAVQALFVSHSCVSLENVGWFRACSLTASMLFFCPVIHVNCRGIASTLLISTFLIPTCSHSQGPLMQIPRVSLFASTDSTPLQGGLLHWKTRPGLLW